ncbi:fibronectin type III domain-containing protein [Paenibacillus piscarius]|uniref:fibronectin type III domain-containing protein n=1 Tax=Paenibacillus piscarius TaxID=1089681 RepID=UPI001EE7C41F|nr:PA14 domain-containing protein [Paenibacillus piscarius]
MANRKRFISKVLCFIILAQFLTPFVGFSGMEISAQDSMIKIRFQPEEVSVQDGELADFGATFGERGNYSYGWNMDHTDTTVSRDTYDNSGMSSLTRIHPDGKWEILLDNGTYEVSVTVGDSVYSSNNSLALENINVMEGLSLEAGEHRTIKKKVAVEDGRLTLSQLSGPGIETALNRIDISLVNTYTPTLLPPQIRLPFEPNKVVGDKVLLSGNMTNVHNAPPFIKVNGLQGEISRHIREQIESIGQQIQQHSKNAVAIRNADIETIQSSIRSIGNKPAVIAVGQLNLESSVTFGSEEQPVILIADGINTNRNLNLTVYGSLILHGGLNANTELDINVINLAQDEKLGNLWVQGTVHLNNNSNVHVDNELFAGSLVYNNGSLDLSAKRVLVQGNMNINTLVTMNVDEEMSVGEVVSNNSKAELNVTQGDLFVRDNVSVNNHLSITTGGLFAVGGNVISNQRPIIHTGNEAQGHTLLKYVLSGLKAEYYSNNDFTGKKAVKVDDSISLSGQPLLGVPGIADQRFSVRWTGQIQPNYTDQYTFSVRTSGGVRLWVNDQLLVDAWTAKQHVEQGTAMLEAGKKYDLKMEYANDMGNPQASLLWESEQQLREVVPSVSLRPFSIPAVHASATDSAITLNWPSLFNADGYEVEFDKEVTVLGSEPGFVKEGLSPGTEHFYRMRAISGDIKGEWSTASSYWTLPAAPLNIQLNATSHTITLVWEPVTGATSYEIEVNNSTKNIGPVLTYQENDLNPNMPKVFRIRAVNSSGAGAWSEVVTKTTLVGVPSKLQGTADEQSVHLHWDAVSGAASYDLEIDGTISNNIMDNSYIHDNLQSNSKHSYRVRAKNDDGISEWSEPITVYTAPGVPQNLAAQVEGNSVHVTWDQVAGATGYDIEVDSEVLDNELKLEFTHSQLPLNSEHTYRVRAKNENRVGSWTKTMVYSTHAGVPNNIQTLANSNEITITWDIVVGALSYDIELDGTTIRNVADNSYIHKKLAPFSTHKYRVRAVNAAGSAEWSGYVSATTTFGKPSNLKALAKNTSIELTWDKVENATGYDVLVDGEVLSNEESLSYKHTGLEPYSWHNYRVRAKHGSFLGEWSEPLTISTVLGIPGNVKTVTKSNQILLSWDSVTGATGYEIEADGTVIDNGSKVTFTHTGLLPNTKHSYRIRAKNTQAVSDWSEWTTIVTGVTAPEVPKNLRGEVTVNSVQLAWDSANGASSYDVEVDGQVISNSNQLEYTHSGLEPNTMHAYRVRAKNAGATSDWSELLKKTTTPAVTIKPEKDTQLNFVMIIPYKSDKSERRVTVTYNANDLEVMDLRAETPDMELGTGSIAGTPVNVIQFEPGKIVFSVLMSNKAAMNTIIFNAKTNQFTKVTYTIE